MGRDALEKGLAEMADDTDTTTDDNTTDGTDNTTDDTVDIEALQRDLAAAQKALTKANRESASRRKKLDDIERQEAERQQAEMTELDKAKNEAEQARREAEAAKEEARTTLMRAAFVSEAAKAGVAHPEDVYRLADLSSVEVGDDGKVEGVADAVQALVDAGRVPLAKTPAPNLDGGAGGGDRLKQQVKLSPVEAQIAKRMGLTEDKFMAQKTAIKERDST